MQEASRLGDFFRNKWVRLALILDSFVLIAIIAIIIYNVTKTATVVFNVAPVDATISLNGNSSYTNNTYAVHPGTYEVAITRDGLDEKVFTVDLPANATTKITIFLAKDGDNFEFYEYEDHLESYEKLASIASAEDNQTTDYDTSAEPFLANQAEKDQISKILPVSFPICDGPATRTNCDSVRISYEYNENCDWKKCVVIKARGNGLTEEYLSLASTYLADNGFILKNYNYVYEQGL